mgnify:CR=1 FL=1|jgi:hypothetical protein
MRLVIAQREQLRHTGEHTPSVSLMQFVLLQDRKVGRERMGMGVGG